jgi:hypothetical protein
VEETTPSPPGSPTELDLPEPKVTNTTDTNSQTPVSSPTEPNAPNGISSPNVANNSNSSIPAINGNSVPTPSTQEANNNKRVEELYYIPPGNLHVLLTPVFIM